MIHPWILLNALTLKAAYPMKRIESILQGIARDDSKVLIETDASNVFWAVKLSQLHRYRTAFSTAFGMYCYKRMGFGTTGGPTTYTWLNVIATGSIPKPDPEPALADCVEGVWFDCSIDDDLGGGKSFDKVLDFLHNHYFPRVLWARLSLSPKKSEFFTSKGKVLRHSKDPSGIRPAEDMMAAFRKWPAQTNEKELADFCHMLPWVRSFIPGRSDKTNILKEALIQERTTKFTKGRKHRAWKTVDFKWTER
ncbi:hypothetical protein TI39_contig5856g00005 [Zymoseptoria brevis]|uniref:Reverse transcriptase domain-containing protein n=1 Tax=Zymoseptoria brevis TaxID=1047168 RepID=A0A0F4G5S5_9PEZI|nr:hypothetical protein TI39_contig5856g00005 [Zymoseptoria brevis]